MPRKETWWADATPKAIREMAQQLLGLPTGHPFRITRKKLRLATELHELADLVEAEGKRLLAIRVDAALALLARSRRGASRRPAEALAGY